jgi:phage terminase large subunit
MFQLTTATQKIASLKKRIRAVQGGTSASKTISILLLLIHEAQSDKTPTLTSVVSESFPHLKRGAMRDFLSIMQQHRYYKDEQWNRSDFIYTFETGSKIEFFSADQPSKTRGPRRDRLFLNECNNITFEAFDQLEVRTKDYVYLDWNPTTEFWFYTEVLGRRDDVEHLIITYLDNEALDPAIVRSIEQRKNNKAWWQVYGLGQLGEIETRIYTGWQIIDSIPHEARLERYGLDFGYTNDPTAIVGIHYYNGGYILDEIAYQKGLSNKMISDILLNQPKALTIADSAEPKSIAEIKVYGLSVMPADKGPGSILQGIQYVQQQKISITKQSINLIKEYRNYVWITDRDGKILNTPLDLYNHAMDAGRYALQSLKPKKKIPLPARIGGVPNYYPELGI